MYFTKLPLLTNFSFLERTKIMFLIITFKRIKLQSRSKSQIVGNCFAVPDLMWFLKIGWDLPKIYLPEVKTFFYFLFLVYLKSTAITFLIITFKRIKLQSHSKSQIVGNCFAIQTSCSFWLRYKPKKFSRFLIPR